MSEKITSEIEHQNKEIFIGCDSFGNEITVVSQRPLGKIKEVKREEKHEGEGDSLSDYFTYETKEIRFGDGEKELACRFVIEHTRSMVSRP